MYGVVNRKTTGLGVSGNTQQVYGNIPNTWEILHWQDISIYFCSNSTMGYVMLGKMFIALRSRCLISKIGIVFPSASLKALSHGEYGRGPRSQDACVLVP